MRQPVMKVFQKRKRSLITNFIKTHDFSKAENKDFNWRVCVPKPLKKVTEIGPNTEKYWSWVNARHQCIMLCGDCLRKNCPVFVFKVFSYGENIDRHFPI